MKNVNPFRLLTLAAAIVACALLWASSAAAATDTVTNADDSGPGSLRDTVAEAAAGDTIRFAVRLTGSTITLTSPITVDKSLTIKGLGSSKLTLSGGGSTRMLDLTGGDLAVSGLNLSSGEAQTEGGAILASGSGSLTISACGFFENAAGGPASAQPNAPAAEGAGFGGAIYVAAGAGPVTVEGSDFEGNTAGGIGGTGAEGGVGHGAAIWDLSSQPLRITESLFDRNAAGGPGGSGAESGAGFGTVGGEGGGSLEIVDSLFQADTAGAEGGSGLESGAGSGAAVWAGPGLSLTVAESEFEENTTGGSGGSGEGSGIGFGAIAVEGPGSSQITDSVFQLDTAGGNGGSGNGSGAGYGGAIFVGPGRSLSLSGSEFGSNVAGGVGNGDGSGAGFGGALAGRGDGSISVSESSFANGTAGGTGGTGDFSGTGFGGAIATQDQKSLAIALSVFLENGTGGQGSSGGYSGVGRGGAVYVGGSGGATIADSTFEANHGGGVRTTSGAGSHAGDGYGGAVFSLADTSITGTTMLYNSAGVQDGSGFGAAGFGGAVDFDLGSGAVAGITNSTLYGNTAGGEVEPGRGGAVNTEGEVNPGEALGSLTLTNDTIDSNGVATGGTGGDGTGSSIGGASAVTLKGTIVSFGGGTTDCDTLVAASENSIEGGEEEETSCGADLPSADPQLEPPAENGGPTLTEALSETSPALDAVPGADCPEVDQRGELRASRLEPFCDVGAYERDPRTAPAITSAASASFEVGKAGSFTVTTTGEPKPVLRESGALPAGVTFVDKGDGTATLAGTPATGSGGTYTITISASNGFVVKPEAVQTFTLTVKETKTPTTPSTPSKPSPSPSPTPPSSTPPPAASPRPAPQAPSLRFAYNPNRAHSPNPHGGPRYTFRFGDGVAGSTYLCRLDRGRFKPCTSPKVYRNLKRGRHVFEVKSVTPEGVESPVRRVGFRAGKPRS